MYQARRPGSSEFIPVRQLRYHVLRWGEPRSSLPPLVLVHGWMDVAASWQFMVDAFSADFLQGRTLIAPDWRGFGLSEAEHHDNYWFPDYLADLDFLLDHYAGEQPVDLVGHSMGGNVATLYAGVRPQRIRRLINLEGFGLPGTEPSQAPGRYARWIDELKSLHRGELALKTYADANGVAQRLRKTNPRLPEDKAQWLARQWARPNGRGEWEILGDAAHKIVNAQLYRVDEVLEIYQCISAPTLSITASDDSLAQWWNGTYTLKQYRERIRRIVRLEESVIDDASHMMHHDQPESLARQIEDFLSR